VHNWIALPSWLSPARALAIGLTFAAVVILWIGRGVSFLGDDWAWLFGGLHITPGSFLKDYNGHLIATTWGAFDIMLASVGFAHPWMYRALALGLALLVAWLLYRYAAARVGAWIAAGLATSFALLGTGADVFLSVNIGILTASAACLGALLLIDRRYLAADLGACLLLLLGVASFTSAFAFVFGVLVELLWRREDRRRAWVALVPAAIYGIWRLHWGAGLGSPGSSPVNVFDVVHHALQSAAAAMAGLGGVQLVSPTLRAHLPWLASAAGIVLVLGAGLGGVFVLRRHRLSPRLVQLVLAAGVLWLLLGIGRGSLGDPYASRYVYMGALMILLILSEAASGTTLTDARLRVGVGLVLLVCTALNIAWMEIWAAHLRDESGEARAQLAALDSARGLAPPDFRPSAAFALAPVTAGSYFRLIGRFGRSPADSPAELRAAPERAREAADGVSVRALGLSVSAVRVPAGGLAPVLEQAYGAQIQAAPGCRVALPQAGRIARLDLRVVSATGLLLSASPSATELVLARRFASRFVTPIGALHGYGLVSTPRGLVGDPWHVRLFVTRRTRICSARPRFAHR
jgi:hypothetical protein